MSDQEQAGNGVGETGKRVSEPAIFSPRPPAGGGIPVSAWVAAAVVVLIVIIGLAFSGRHKGEPAATDAQRLDPYAASLPLSQLAMSESTSLVGGKSTFIDGHIKNTGSATVTGITVQVLFGNLEGNAPQIDTMPLTLIRTRQPYVDIQSVASSPLKPGDEREFRLIFESIRDNWNMQMPEIRIVGVEKK